MSAGMTTINTSPNTNAGYLNKRFDTRPSRFIIGAHGGPKPLRSTGEQPNELAFVPLSDRRLPFSTPQRVAVACDHILCCSNEHSCNRARCAEP